MMVFECTGKILNILYKHNPGITSFCLNMISIFI